MVAAASCEPFRSGWGVPTARPSEGEAAAAAAAAATASSSITLPIEARKRPRDEPRCMVTHGQGPREKGERAEGERGQPHHQGGTDRRCLPSRADGVVGVRLKTTRYPRQALARPSPERLLKGHRGREGGAGGRGWVVGRPSCAGRTWPAVLATPTSPHPLGHLARPRNAARPTQSQHQSVLATGN